MTPDCQYLTPTDTVTGRGLCLLGYYGGKTRFFLCRQCIACGQNTHKAAEQLFARAQTPGGNTPQLPPPAKVLPPFTRRISNFSKAVVADVKAGMPRRSEEESANLLSICQECEMIDTTKQFCTHQKCGCKMSRKVAWESAHCPLNKW